MSDINLLPDELREKEQKDRQRSTGDESAPQFYNPREKNVQPVEGSPPNRWQQLISALKKNISSAGSSQTPVSATKKPLTPSAPVKSASPKIEVSRSISSQQTAPAQSLSSVPPTKIQSQPTNTISPKDKMIPPLGGKEQSGFIGVPPLTTLDVNLIPAQEGQVTSQSLTAMIALISGSLLIVLLGYLSLRTYVANKQAESEAIQQEIITLQQDLEKARAGAERAIADNHRVVFLADVLKKQTNWENFFTWLESRTIPTVQFQNLAADASGSITLAGTAPSFTEVGRQMLAFQQSDKVKEITLSGVSVERDMTRSTSPAVIKFNFAIKLPSSLFLANVQP